MNVTGKQPDSSIKAGESNLKSLQMAFAAHLRDPENKPGPEGIEDRRMAIYRELFFNNIQGFLANNFPVIRKLFDESAWKNLVRDFFVTHRAHTPLFPELPREFLQYLQDHDVGAQLEMPFLLELAHYEWAELAVSLDDNEIDAEANDPDGDLLTGVPYLSPVAWPLTYSFPVHQIRPEFQPAEPPAQATHLLVYRRRDDKVRFMVLNPVSARLAELLKANLKQTGLNCLNQIAEEMGFADTDALVRGGLEQMEDFRRRAIIPGTRLS